LKENKQKFQTGNVLTISITHMVHDIYSSFLAPILPLLIEKLSISYSMVGLLTVIQRIPSLLNPLVGIVADKISVRYLLIIAPSITAVSMSLLGVAPHYTALAILLFMMGIGASLFHVPSPVMIKEVAGARIGKGMSFYMFGGEAARSIGPLVILGAVSVWGLEGTWKLIPFGLLASFILYLRFRKIPISDKLKERKSEIGLFTTFKDHLPLFFSIGGIVFFNSLIKGSLTTFLPIFLTSEGETLWFSGIALSTLQLAGAVGTFTSGTISDRIGRKKTLLIMATVNPILLLSFIFANDLLRFPILLTLGLFLFASTPVLLALVNDTRSEHPSFINGIFMTVNFSFGAIGVFCVGLLADVFGLQTTYLIAACGGVFTLLFILISSNQGKTV
jgi:FSR family fosmidomycin resistance protein-like MFS transporter